MSDEAITRMVNIPLNLLSAILIVYWSGLVSGRPDWKLWFMFCAISLINTGAGVWAGFFKGWAACERKQSRPKDASAFL